MGMIKVYIGRCDGGGGYISGMIKGYIGRYDGGCKVEYYGEVYW